MLDKTVFLFFCFCCFFFIFCFGCMRSDHIFYCRSKIFPHAWLNFFTLTFRACALDSPFLLDRLSLLIVNCLLNCPCKQCWKYPHLKLTQTKKKKNKLPKFNLKKQKNPIKYWCLLLWVSRYSWYVCFLKRCFWLFINFVVLISQLFKWLLLTFFGVSRGRLVSFLGF